MAWRVDRGVVIDAVILMGEEGAEVGVPVMVPVVGSRVTPGGSPVAVYVTGLELVAVDGRVAMNPRVAVAEKGLLWKNDRVMGRGCRGCAWISERGVESGLIAMSLEGLDEG